MNQEPTLLRESGFNLLGLSMNLFPALPASQPGRAAKPERKGGLDEHDERQTSGAGLDLQTKEPHHSRPLPHPFLTQVHACTVCFAPTFKTNSQRPNVKFTASTLPYPWTSNPAFDSRRGVSGDLDESLIQ